MKYINEYAYGQVGTTVARKKLLTGKVEVYHVDRWVKCAPAAAKTFTVAELEEEPAPAPQPTPKPAKKFKPAPAKKVARVNAAELDTPPVLNGDEPPAVIDMEAVKRRAAADQARAMEALTHGPIPTTSVPPEPGQPELEVPDDNPFSALGGSDADGFAQRVEEILNELDDVQLSSASGAERFRHLRMQLREALADYKGEQ